MLDRLRLPPVCQLNTLIISRLFRPPRRLSSKNSAHKDNSPGFVAGEPLALLNTRLTGFGYDPATGSAAGLFTVCQVVQARGPKVSPFGRVHPF